MAAGFFTCEPLCGAKFFFFHTLSTAARRYHGRSSKVSRARKGLPELFPLRTMYAPTAKKIT